MRDIFLKSLKWAAHIYRYTDIYIIYRCKRHKAKINPLSPTCSPRTSITHAVADLDGFLTILSKLNYLKRYNRHPQNPKLTLCLPPAR